MFPTQFNNNPFICRECSYFCPDVFKVICCRFVVCGKGLNIYKIRHVTMTHKDIGYVSLDLSFPTYRRMLTHLQKTTFENNMTKGEIAQNKQFFLLPQRFLAVIITSFLEIFHISLVDEVICCKFVVCEKGF